MVKNLLQNILGVVENGYYVRDIELGTYCCKCQHCKCLMKKIILKSNNQVQYGICHLLKYILIFSRTIFNDLEIIFNLIQEKLVIIGKKFQILTLVERFNQG